MACVYPGAHSPEELWQNILAGRRLFRKMPAERLPQEYFDPDPTIPGKSYCDQAAVITNWTFDPVAFRIPPVTVEASDLAHWLALSTGKAAIADAGLDLETLDRSRIGVALGNTLTGEFFRSHALRFRWPYVDRAIRRVLKSGTSDTDQVDALIAAVQQVYEAPLPEITEDSLAGNMSNTIAGRICNYFDLGAGGYTIDGACSSSLLAVAMACNALRDGDMDIALAGGVDVSLDPFEIVGFAKTRALAVDDIRPYDERAAGMMTGEGCGLLVLMREEDARAAGYRIHALIRGWGYSSDGKGGLTAPEVEGQARALRRAYERAGYSIATVGLIEGHGTGTALGDKVEISAIRSLLDASPGEDTCWLGSIKANIGHCKAAAGAAGLIKAVMALKRKIVPPTVNCDRPNSVFGKPMGRLRPSLQGQVWTAGSTPRRASVSSMGFGGANSHVTLEEANLMDAPLPEELTVLGSHQRSELILLSADSRQALQEKVERLLPIAERICRAELTDLAAALAQEPQTGTVRLAFVADSPWQLATALRSVSQKLSENISVTALNDREQGIFAGVAIENPSLVALFPGQGSQRLNMGEHLLRRYPFIRELYDQAETTLGDVIPSELSATIFRDLLAADEATRSIWEAELRQTRNAQPAIVLSSLAMLRLLEFFGLRSTVAIGHSLGEISALCAAGACDASTAVRIAALRGQAMTDLHLDDPGSMAAMTADLATVEKFIAPFGSTLTISNYNSPKQTVVSGTSAAIEALVKACTEQNVRCTRLPVSHAFHSDLVAPAATAFRQALTSVSFQTLSGKVISTATGQEITADTNIHHLLSDHIRQPVRFVEAVKQAAQQQPTLWIEIGPGGVLTTLVRDILGPDNVTCLSTDLAGEEGFHTLNAVLARAFVCGFPLALNRLLVHRFVRPFPLNDYHPIFITNPCERPVEVAAVSFQPMARVLPNSLLPSDANSSDVAAYLAQRGSFLRDFIALDYRHHVGNGKAAALPIALVTHLKPAAATTAIREETTPDRDLLLTFAIEWIARRTGFPKTSISPEMRLRDDLNLDSIKVGELVIVLSRKLQQDMPLDPAMWANAQLGELVTSLESDLGREHSQQTLRSERKALLSSVESISSWVRLFCMEPIPVPVESETPLLLPSTGNAHIIGNQNCPRVQAIARALYQQGLAPIVVDTTSLPLRDNDDSNPAVIIVVLPEVDSLFSDCAPATFDERVEGLATTLFSVFRWASHGHEANWSDLRCIVLRPRASSQDLGLDLNAGSAFVKSLQLEHPQAQLKWIDFPTIWMPEQCAEMAISELGLTSPYVTFSYIENGQRTVQVALPFQHADGPPTSLSKDDVVLVTGGAKGITCELALALARQTGAKLALLGSSSLPDRSTDSHQHEILRNLRRFEQEGVRHIYLQCNVTDLNAVQKTVSHIEQTLGSVTAILHGAGVSELRLFRDMDIDSYLRCIRVKARGLYNLLVAVPPRRLKALHVLSSVLGKTGMRSQADYTFANAWLDGALVSLKASYSHIQCLSLGYSVWQGTGMGQKLQTLDYLASVGVTPIRIEDGVVAYLKLLDGAGENPCFVITGNLTPNLEAHLFPPTPPLRGRFLEQVLRWIPVTEIVAEATISHETDLYLPEHVFEGTPLFPGVMAIEAMVEAAMACVGRDDLPVVRNIHFRRPLIVPEDAKITMRTLALADAPEGNTLCVRVAIRSDTDNFKEDHFSAACIFGSEPLQADELPMLPYLPEPLPQNPEDFSPVPLFQGKFFRRITAIRALEMGKESLTEVQVPDGERYYSKPHEQIVVTPSPAARDAFLQSSALILPPGCLPESIQELRFHQGVSPGRQVLCHVLVNENAGERFLVDFSMFTLAGELVETVRGCVLRAPKVGERVIAKPLATPIPFSRLGSDLRALLPKVPLTLVVVSHEELQNLHDLSEVTKVEIEQIYASIPIPRQQSVLANLVATRRATRDFAHQYRNLDLTSAQVSISYQADGKPELQFDDASVSQAFADIDVSLADGAGISIALIGPAPVGVDIEIVATRDAETWRGLLGDDGYALALRLATEASEPFDRAATRVWTLLEAGKKSAALKRIIPEYDSASEDTWLSFSASVQKQQLQFFCAPCILHPAVETLNVLTVVVGNPTQDITPNQYTDKENILVHHFPLSFKDNCSLTGNVPISVIASWMGKFREIVLAPIQQQLLISFSSEGFGAVTNRSSIHIFGTTQAMETIEGRQWMSKRSCYDKSSMVIAYDWMRVLSNGRRERIASSEVDVTWVQITGRGKAEVAPIPEYFLSFLRSLGMLETKNDEVGQEQGILWNLERGEPLYQSPAGPRLGLPLLCSRYFETSLEHANLIGNVYYTNYYVWSGHVRDQFFYRLIPTYYEHQGKEGELYCIDARMEHLQEAMPFETISASMYLSGLSENEVQLYFEFYSTAPNGQQRKLAYSDQTLIWITPKNATPTVARAPLPQQLVDNLLRVAGGRDNQPTSATGMFLRKEVGEEAD